MSDDFFKPGDMLLEYQLLEIIGEGGMGTVFKAIHEEYNDVVAIKVILPKFAYRADYSARFKQECIVYTTLKHPHIVRMRRAGIVQPPQRASLPQPPPVPFVVMDFLEGKTLRKILNQYHRFDYLNALYVMLQVAEALSVAHMNDVVHRDLKPDNIMIGSWCNEKGWVTLLDFGIAMVLGGISTVDMPDIGTARYMAPEQARNILNAAKKVERAKLDHRVDIYAFGVIFYEVVTGVHIFIEEHKPLTFDETLMGHLLAEPVPIHHLVLDCEPDLWPIVEKCLEKNPSGRYQSFDDVLADLQLLIRGSVPPTHPLGRRVHAEKANKARREAYNSLHAEAPVVLAPEASQPGREALVPDPPKPSREPHGLHPEVRDVAVAPVPPANRVACASTPKSPTDAASPVEGRATLELVNYTPRVNPLPFVPPAALFVPPAIPVTRSGSPQRGGFVEFDGTVKVNEPLASSPTFAAALASHSVVIPAASPKRLAKPVEPETLAASRPILPRAVAPMPSCAMASVAENSRIAQRIEGAQTASPPRLEHARESLSEPSTSKRATPPTDPAMSRTSRSSARHLLFAPVLGFLIVSTGFAGVLVARGRSPTAAAQPSASTPAQVTAAPLGAPSESALPVVSAIPPLPVGPAVPAEKPSAPPPARAVDVPVAAASTQPAQGPAAPRFKPLNPSRVSTFPTRSSPARTPVIPLVE